MNADFIVSLVVSPVGLLVGAAICGACALAYLGLRRRWTTPGYARSARATDTVVLLVTTLAALLLALGVGVLLAQQDARANMQRELAERSAQSKALQAQVGAQLAAARQLLADRAIEKIAQEKLVEARAELARFTSFKDPGIAQMIALIDRELEIRELVRQRMLRGDPP